MDYDKASGVFRCCAMGIVAAALILHAATVLGAESEGGGILTTLDHRGLRVRTEDGRFGIEIGGRLHAQASAHAGSLPDGVDATDGTEVRRARFELKGTIFEDWRWIGEVDFADNETAIKDFWLGYTGFGRTKLFVGHQKQPYSLSVEMSSNDIPFIERSVDNDLIIPFIDRAIGARVETSGAHWFAAAGLYGEGADPNRSDDEGWGTAGRFVAAPILGEGRVLHLGARAAYRQPSGASDSVRMKDETTHMSNLSIVDTGTIDDVSGTVLVGAEAMAILGPISAFAEYNQAFIDRNTGGDLDFDSWHVAATWSVTGESRAAAYRIDAGELKRLTPTRNFHFDGSGWGAWEIAARVASIDLNDGPISGGEEKVLTTALNWYVNPAIRLMFEWSRILATEGAGSQIEDAEGLNVFQFRTQFTL